jgi:hypothetical protein
VAQAVDAGAPASSIAARFPPAPSNVDPSAPATGIVAPPSRPPGGDALCVTAFGGKGTGIKAGQAASIRLVRPNPCHGNACSGAKAKCVAKRKGKTILVVPDFPTAVTKPRVPCTEDCGGLVATCKTDPLPPGAYTLDVGGGRRETIQVPSSGALVCDE